MKWRKQEPESWAKDGQIPQDINNTL
jgi:hypothetical protein